MLNTLQKMLALLTPAERYKVFGLTVANILLAILDMVGIASIFPFLKVVSDPHIILTNSKLKWAYDFFGFQSTDQFIIALGLCTFALLLGGNIFRAWIAAAMNWISWMKRAVISTRLLKQYLYEPYEFFLNRNSADLVNYLMSEVARVISQVLIPLMDLIAKCVFILLIFSLLVIVSPVITLVVSVVFGGGYGCLYLFFRKKLSQTGQEFQKNNEGMYRSLNEAFGGIKEIKILGKEKAFLEKFSKPATKNVMNYCLTFSITTIPKYILESLAFGGILLITIYSVIVNKNYSQAVPMIGLYTVAAYRLIPTLQQIFQDITSIRIGKSALDYVYQDFTKAEAFNPPVVNEQITKLPFSQSIKFTDLDFKYPRSPKDVISHFNLTIVANTTVGFVGGTGAGKTTIIDILLGLLTPQKGEIYIDGLKIDHGNVRSWQKNIGYVPQHIFLSDDTIARNIAYGLMDDNINDQAVEQAAKLANIHDFIMTLPKGYATEVGDRGVRLSGGERQRIGIARALYHNPSLLVFDEATSALDGITEQAVIEAIHDLSSKKTIILIAHRLSTVKDCSTIYLLEKGKIIDQGTYDHLLTNNKQFQKMAYQNIT